MARDLTAAMVTELTADVVAPILLVKMAFDSGDVMVWSGLGDLAVTTHTFDFTPGTMPTDAALTRATDDYDGSFVDANGVIQDAAANAARFTHAWDGDSWELDGLLNEPASDNVILRSEEFGSGWTATRAVVNANAATAPDGSVTADRLKDNSAGGSNSSLLSQTVTVATATTYTFSVYLKADQVSWAAIVLANFTTPVSNTSAWFDLGNGVAGTKAAGYTSSRIEDAGDGWYRCSVTFTTDAADTSGIVRLYLAEADNSTSVALDGTTSLFLWGAQLETGETGSTYIPTATSAQGRAADVLVLTVPDGDYDITITRASGTEELSGEAVSGGGGYTVPTSTSPLRSVVFQQVYTGVGDLGSVSPAAETQAIAAPGAGFTLSGIPSSLIATALGEDYQERTATMWLGALDLSTGALVDEPYILFRGRMDVMTIDEGAETATITVTAENRLIDLEVPKVRRYTAEDQKQLYAGDTGLDQVTALQDAEVIWGRR